MGYWCFFLWFVFWYIFWKELCRYLCVFSQCLLIYMCVDFNHYCVWILIITWWCRMSLYLLLVYLDFITWGSVLLSLALVVRTYLMCNQTNKLKQNIYISSEKHHFYWFVFLKDFSINICIYFICTLYALYMYFICIF